MKNKVVFIFGIVLLIALIATYWNHFDNGFHFDDSHTIVNNVHITKIENIPHFFYNNNLFSSSPFNKGIRPVVSTTLAIDYWLAGGLNPFYFHLSTFIIYLILIVLLFLLFKKIINISTNHNTRIYLLFFSVSLFSLHTVNAETINYIISRSDVLSTFFIVLSFVLYIYAPSARKYYIYVIPAIFGVFSKETLATLPILLFFYIAFFEKNLSIYDIINKNHIKKFIRIFIDLIPLIAVIIITQLYTLSKAGTIAGLSNPTYNYIITQPYVWLHYFISFFLPVNLSADTDWKVFDSIFDDRAIIGFIFLFLLIFYIIKFSKNKTDRPISFGLLWFAVALIPTSIVPLAEVLNDHRMFYPFIGLTLATCYFIFIKLKNYKTKSPKFFQNLCILCGIGILFAYAYGAHQRNKVWQNGETLWYDVTVKSPNNARGLMNYGLELMAQGKYETAMTYYDKALQIAPNYDFLYINIGILKNATNKRDEAELNFKKAIQLNSLNDLTHFYYAKFLKEQNRLNEAISSINEAVKLSPLSIRNNILKLNLLVELEYWDQAKKTAKEILEIDPDNTIAKNVLSTKKLSKLELKRIAVQNDPSAQKYLDLSLEYYNLGEYKKCIEACQQALILKPDYYLAYNNICTSYNQLNEFKLAEEACQKALDINPEFELAKNNLKWARSQLNKK
ncbi:MAG: hypothetical protein CL613_10385 [Aquimarina sp.]|nr:hypothetical protein [Aquimarina sp.]